MLRRTGDEATTVRELSAVASEDAEQELRAASRSQRLLADELQRQKTLQGADAETLAEALVAAAEVLDARHDPRGSWNVRSAFFSLARHPTSMLAADTTGARYLVASDDQVVARATFVTREPFEVGSLDALLELITSCGLARPSIADGVFLDVGANIGTTSVEVLRRYPGARAVAFEPVPANVQHWRLNLLVKSLSCRAHVVPYAASEADGFVELELAPGNSGDHRVRVGPAQPGEQGETLRPTTNVRAVRIDTLVDEGEIVPEEVSIVWIDAQDHEVQILAGATSLVAARRPVVIEYWPYGLLRAGGLDRLNDLIADRFSEVLDLERPAGEAVPAAQIGELAAVLGRHPESFTELLLVP